MTQTLIKPLGNERDRLIENLGRDSWVYAATPAKSTVNHKGKTIDVWRLAWAYIPADVQDAMVRTYSATHDLPRREARLRLAAMIHAIPCADVELEAVPE